MNIRWIHSWHITGLLLVAVLGLVLFSRIHTEEAIQVFPEPFTLDETKPTASPITHHEQTDSQASAQPAAAEATHQAPAVFQVYGTITDEHDVPIESVTVQLKGGLIQTRSGPRGNYRMNIETGLLESYSLIFLRSGYKPHTLTMQGLEYDQDNAIAYDIKLEYSPVSIAVEGWLSDADGLVVSGQLVELASQEGEYFVTSVSDERGRFAFEAVALGDDYRLDIRSSGAYKAFSMQYLQLSAQMLPLYISIEPLNLRTMNGVVLDSYGLPVPGFVATVRNLDMRDYTASLETDELGRFTLVDFPLGEIMVTSDTPRLLSISRVRATELSYDNLVVPVDLGTHQLSGWVRDRYGKPVLNARVVLESSRSDLDKFSVSTRMVKTDKNGHYEFKGLSAAGYDLTIYARGFINEGIQYHPGTGIDKLYFRLSRWSENL